MEAIAGVMELSEGGYTLISKSVGENIKILSRILISQVTGRADMRAIQKRKMNWKGR